MKKRIRLTFNAPVTLTFSIVCAAVLALNNFVFSGSLTPALFTCPGNKNCPFPFEWKSAINYVRIFTHIFGHTDWNHFLNNFAFILLLGPLMEERYGSFVLTLMILMTAFVTGVINVCFIPHALLGASGVAFMLIILSSISTLDKSELPISFLFVLAIYAGREIFSVGSGGKSANISSVAHIAGGLCGAASGFFAVPKTGRISKPARSKNEVAQTQPPASKKPRSKSKKARAADDEATIVSPTQL